MEIRHSVTRVVIFCNTRWKVSCSYPLRICEQLSSHRDCCINNFCIATTEVGRRIRVTTIGKILPVIGVGPASFSPRVNSPITCIEGGELADFNCLDFPADASEIGIARNECEKLAHVSATGDRGPLG